MKDSLNDGMVLPPKAAPVPEPDLPLWEETTSVVSSQSAEMTNLQNHPAAVSGGTLIMCLLFMAVRRFLNLRKRS